MDEPVTRSLTMHCWMENSFYAFSLISGALCAYTIAAIGFNFDGRNLSIETLQAFELMYAVATLAYAGARKQRWKLFSSLGLKLRPRPSEFIIIGWWVYAIIVILVLIWRSPAHVELVWEIVKILAFITGIFMGGEVAKMVLNRWLGDPPGDPVAGAEEPQSPPPTDSG